MKLKEFDLEVIYINLSTRPDRKILTENELNTIGLEAKRQRGIQARFVRNTRGFRDKSRYACSLAKRIAIRRAKLSGAKALLLLEDDVVFHRYLHERLDKISLPDDWQLFFLGCQHMTKPEVISEGLVKCTRAVGNHALIIRRESFSSVIAALSGPGRTARKSIRFSDVKLAEIQEVVPTYSCFPNLAWQRTNFSDNALRVQKLYEDDGRQVENLHAVSELGV